MVIRRSRNTFFQYFINGVFESDEALRACAHDIPKRNSDSTDAVEIFDLIAQQNTRLNSGANFDSSLMFAPETQGENNIDKKNQ
jgi:hypothetical protein